MWTELIFCSISSVQNTNTFTDTMGRPGWANEEQWDWLKAQALKYLKIKGTKETPRFWGPFFNLGEWAIASHGKGTRPFMKVAAEAVYSKIS
jgi:hypothetical protein